MQYQMRRLTFVDFLGVGIGRWEGLVVVVVVVGGLR